MTAKATKSNVSDKLELTLICQSVIYQTELSLTKGINNISLPLNTEPSYTASTLANALNSTIVIQVKDGLFDAYVHAGQIGTDFPIQMGQGYIVNLMEAQNFQITGKPWGEPVPAAPSILAEPWAFVIAGQIEGEVPVGVKLRATNLRTKESIVVPISPSGQFIAAFVDMSQRSVVGVGDEFMVQLIGADGTSRSPEWNEGSLHVLQDDIARAYLLTHLSAKPEQSRLLQNYPNPFNPETWIPFRLAENLDVKIRVYDIQGRLVRELVLGRLEAGVYEQRDKAAYWNGRNEQGEQVANGVYLYQMVAGKKTFTRRMVVLK